MDNTLSFALAWAITASLSTIYYVRRTTKLIHICDACMLGFKAIAEGNATISLTKDGIRIKGKDSE